MKMKKPSLKRDLVPVQEFRAGLAHWIQHVESTGRPVVVTQRGRAAAVLVDPAMLDELEEGRELVDKALRGLREAKAGELLDDQYIWADVAQVIAASERKRAR